MFAATGMTYDELVEAMVFTKIRGPIGHGREDAYQLMQAMAVFAAQRGTAFNPRDYMTWLPEPDVWTEEDEEPYDPENDDD